MKKLITSILSIKITIARFFLAGLACVAAAIAVLGNSVDKGGHWIGTIPFVTGIVASSVLLWILRKRPWLLYVISLLLLAIPGVALETLHNITSAKFDWSDILAVIPLSLYGILIFWKTIPAIMLIFLGLDYWLARFGRESNEIADRS